MAYDTNKGISQLGAVLRDQMQKTTEKPLCLDFGVIQSDGSLMTNTFAKTIPKSDYSVCRLVGGLTHVISGGKHGGHESGNGSHTHTVAHQTLRPGDRVLVAWVQNEAVVIDVVVKA